MNEFCEWGLGDPDSDHWVTECHNDFIIIDGTPTDNKMKFCCYCGKKLREEQSEVNRNDQENYCG